MVAKPSSSTTASKQTAASKTATTANTRRLKTKKRQNAAKNSSEGGPAASTRKVTVANSGGTDMLARAKSVISKHRKMEKRKGFFYKDKKEGPKFAKLSAKAVSNLSRETRKVSVPPHRMTPLRAQWMQVYEPIVRHLKLQIRMNLKTKSVDLKTGPHTTDPSALQKGQDFVKAFILGFAVADAIALVRLDDLYIETFEVKDIRSTLKGDHLARAVGRITGKDGRTKFTIENATKTRIVVADTKIHILGSYENTRIARHSISSLVLGSAPGKVYNKLRTISSRLNDKKF